MLSCGIAICSLQLEQFTALPRLFVQRKDADRSAGQLNRMSALELTGVVLRAEGVAERHLISVCRSRPAAHS